MYFIHITTSSGATITSYIKKLHARNGKDMTFQAKNVYYLMNY
jgi:hypothetical protein